MRALRSFALLAVVVLAAACDDDVTGPRLPTDVTFDPSLNVNLAAMTEVFDGLYIQTLTAGEGGAVETGDRVVVDYTLWLPDGSLIDSGADVAFTLAVGAVIDGFRLGMEGMGIGETRLIVVPSALGYGAAGNQGIPPHSVLVFRVTLDALNPPT
ncbi:FKBP-type peptidyl-prolyl cis-trans isomerase [Gaopeijia maritima]|uniref:Peptidyl-prolyl cis-trans isomerase n=1 Tax=Gaopeijia maritima TaxID=3119007 RepID=A0ABU9E8R3_9BACT